ncbi:multidrug effflux MFS transporter [Actinoallomurus iriomotensis]|uniref:Bcr/CflA family drug resistance efflux transporter n=1 Tax=Actinoallomurus iriomotensis TaxID=478107 RepID=A0A9W6RYA0_9ACTN|nr:multidrug effflux MFS transporter [Actinoallomurus iriomotensis]GLY82347.1 Bcr/CflA family drug resistance efflux transporter [Actinoallomurus iriomotensis]
MTAIAERTRHAAGRAERIRVFLILGALSAIGPLSIDMYLPALPKLTRDLSAGPSLVQLTLTACMIGLAAGQVIAGPISDMWGRRRPMFAGIAIYTVASLACVVAPNVELLVALRLIQGVSGAACIVISRAVVRDMHDGPAAARFFSLLMLVNGIAPVAAPVIGAQVLRFTDWRGVFGVLALLGLLMTVSMLGLRETLPAEQRHTGGLRAAVRTFGELCADRIFMGYALAGGFAFAAMFAYISGSPFVVQNIYGLSPQDYSLIFAVNSLGIVAFGQVSGLLVGRVRLITLLHAGLLVSLAGGVLLLVAVFGGLGLPVVLPALFLVVSAIGLTLPNSTALALTGRPANVAGSASALFGLLQYVVGAVAAPLVGLAGGHSAAPMAIVIAASAAVGIVLLAALTRGHRPAS